MPSHPGKKRGGKLPSQASSTASKRSGGTLPSQASSTARKRSHGQQGARKRRRR